MINNKAIGAKIRYLRITQDLSQESLADLADISRVSIGHIERGERTPNLETIIKIANALHSSTDKLLTDCLASDRTSEDSLLLTMLDDCSKEEIDILLQNLQYLKSILRTYRITK